MTAFEEDKYHQAKNLKKICQFFEIAYNSVLPWKGGRAVECSGLENRR